jgi:hypothetical protein
VYYAYVPERSCPAAQSRQATEPRRRGAAAALSQGTAPSATARSAPTRTRGNRGAIGDDLLGQGKVARSTVETACTALHATLTRCMCCIHLLNAVAGTCSPVRGEETGCIEITDHVRRPPAGHHVAWPLANQLVSLHHGGHWRSTELIKQQRHKWPNLPTKKNRREGGRRTSPPTKGRAHARLLVASPVRH